MSGPRLGAGESGDRHSDRNLGILTKATAEQRLSALCREPCVRAPHRGVWRRPQEGVGLGGGDGRGKECVGGSGEGTL